MASFGQRNCVYWISPTPLWMRWVVSALLALTFLVSVGCAPKSGKVYRYEQAASSADERRKADAAYNLALDQIQSHNPAEARQNLEAATRYDPAFGKAFNNLGCLHLDASDLYQAAWAFRRAAKLMPSSPAPLTNLGLVMERGGRWDEAIDLHTKALRLDRANPKYTARLARAKVRRGDRDEETVELLEKVQQQGPGDDWPRWARRELRRQTDPASKGDQEGG